MWYLYMVSFLVVPLAVLAATSYGLNKKSWGRKDVIGSRIVVATAIPVGIFGAFNPMYEFLFLSLAVLAGSALVLFKRRVVNLHYRKSSK